MKNKDWERGRGGGLNREGGLINFPPLKRGGLFERGGLNRGFIFVYTHLGLSTSCSNFLKTLLKTCSKTLKVAQKLPQNPKVAFNFLV